METNIIQTIIIDADEIRSAIRYWLHMEKGITDECVIDFDTKEVWDSSDWQGRWGPIGTELTQARIIIKSKKV